MSAGGQYMGDFTTVGKIPLSSAPIHLSGTGLRRRNRHGLGYLGQTATPSSTSASAAIAAAIAQANPSHKSPDDTTMTTAVQGMQLTPGYTDPSQCSQAGKGVGTASKVEAAAGSAAIQVGTKIAVVNPIAGGVVMVAGAIATLIGAITGHHAQAVANEQTILCQAVPATNQALEAIISAVQGGQMAPSDGIAALQQVLSAFTSEVKPITKSCNEACGLTKELNAIVYYLTQQFQAIPASSAVPATGAFGSTLGGSIAGIPIWMIAAGAAALLLLG